MTVQHGKLWYFEICLISINFLPSTDPGKVNSFCPLVWPFPLPFPPCFNQSVRHRVFLFWLLFEKHCLCQALICLNLCSGASWETVVFKDADQCPFIDPLPPKWCSLAPLCPVCKMFVICWCEHAILELGRHFQHCPSGASRLNCFFHILWFIVAGAMKKPGLNVPGCYFVGTRSKLVLFSWAFVWLTFGKK